jgi:excinuclease ABC subunit A
VEVGLGYLSLDRQSRTLSGGEAQRVALTSALGAALTGTMFVLDEPTVGLHPRDVTRLAKVVRELVTDDNLAIVVEHDPEMLRSADRVVELGPGAGEQGGQVVFDGTPGKLARTKTATGRALGRAPDVRRERRSPHGWLHLRGASGHNLQDVDLSLPLGTMTCITGVSGSGKSSLALETLRPAVARALERSHRDTALPFEEMEGHEQLQDVVQVDQAPLGRTSRGNPATYLKAWDVIRKRFCAEPLAKERRYTPGFFSFNVAGGRCEACKGEGAETVEMQFLADVTFSCPECKGRRFVGPVLDIKHRGYTIADVLEMTINEALSSFNGDRELADRLEPLVAVGLGYLRVGQPLNTLSGGEAQRLKLAEAVARATPGSLLVLDEPTAGLHSRDVTPLLEVIDRLVERGDTVAVVEHDMRVAAHADHVIDLGPGAGENGGWIVASGTPEDVAGAAESETAGYLARMLGEADGTIEAPSTRSAPRKKRRSAGRANAMEVEGAREHNLRNVMLQVPREQLVVVTGPSGSGKSTLAFDVLYAEGQRRYLETLSPYARQYMPQLPRPTVDRVVGVPPSVSLEQRTTRGGSKSTVATITEVAHYLRLVWARAGLLHCIECGVPIAPRAPTTLARDLRERVGKRTKVTVLAPVVRGRKGNHREIIERALKEGYTEARIDGRKRKLEAGMKLERYKEHDVDLIVDTLRADADGLEQALSSALHKGDGTARVQTKGDELLLSSKRACPSCGTGYPELDPRFFSFNTRQGECERCEGRGAEVRFVGRGKNRREELVPCDECEGTRLSPLARSVTVDGRPIHDLLGLDVSEARKEIPRIQLTGREAEIAEVPLAEAERRLAFLDEVGLGYLGLDRSADTLSGGEMQRVRLAAQLGSGLTGVLYVLDEPTIGLHPRDTGRLLSALRKLVDRGNSVLVVEHDADTIRSADHIVDVGPGGGRNGGQVVAQGAPDGLLADPSSVTGPAIAREASVPEQRRPAEDHARWLELVGAGEHNLKDVTLKVPLGRLVTVTGVSGSGKSTLVREVLLRATRHALDLVNDEPPGQYRTVRGAKHLKRAVEVDQSPIGRTPRSVPATYIGIWDEIRRLLAGTPEARARGWSASRFSFNVDGGRCAECAGQGALSVEMSFLPEVLIPCEACGGQRFNPETLQVRWREYSVGELLDLDIADAVEVFESVPKVRRALELMRDLGLGYLKLGQASNTLSGGEAQRLKLVSEMAAVQSGPTLYVLDEPTTGLHRDDVVRLLGVLDQLVDRGDTVVVIEHQPDVILASDWVADLGPEGGQEGGEIVAEGTPEAIMDSAASHTGEVLRRETGARAPGAPRSKRKRRSNRAGTRSARR